MDVPVQRGRGQAETSSGDVWMQKWLRGTERVGIGGGGEDLVGRVLWPACTDLM